MQYTVVSCWFTRLLRSTPDRFKATAIDIFKRVISCHEGYIVYSLITQGMQENYSYNCRNKQPQHRVKYVKRMRSRQFIVHILMQ